MKSWRKVGIAGLVLLAASAGRVLAQKIVVTPLDKSGIYHVGEKIEWTVSVDGDAAVVKNVSYVAKKGQMTDIGHGALDLSAGPQKIDLTLDEPQSVLTEITATINGKKVTTLAGAIADPEKIKVSAPPPDDFEAFWKSKIEELNKVPANPQEEPADSGKEGVSYFKIKMDNINGSHIYGQLAKPKKEGKSPALLLVQYAGVYGLPKNNVVRRGAEGWLALNIMAHDLPFDQPEDFYKKAAATTLKDYIAIGEDSRDTSYFLRMYLACYRSVEYLSGRPDWDGKTLVVMGTSQGGQQSLVTAGINPKITAMLANVPAGCDVTGPSAGRLAGFPYWAARAGWEKKPQVIQTGRYFDAGNFAARIKCPSLVALGLIDQTCPAAGVFSAYNQIQGPKEVIVMVNSDHHGTGNAQAEFFKTSEQWLAKMVKGEPPPVK